MEGSVVENSVTSVGIHANNSHPTPSTPTLDEIIRYCQHRNSCVDPRRFYNYYTANGWMIGSAHMQDWQAAVRSWESKELSKQSNNYSNPFAAYIEVPNHD